MGGGESRRGFGIKPLVGGVGFPTAVDSGRCEGDLTGVKRASVRRCPGKADRPMLHFPECGLDNVYLANGWRWHDTPIGRFLQIKDDRNLIAALASHIIDQPHQPSGQELRYLRIYLNLHSVELGQLLGLRERQVERWERQTSKIKPAVFRLLSLLVRERIGGTVKVEACLREAAANANKPRGKRLPRVVAFRRSGWKIREAGRRASFDQR